MPQTIATLADSMATQLGESYQDLDVRELFDAWLLECIVEFAQYAPWPFLLATDVVPTAAGTRQYELSNDLGDVLSIQRGDTYGEMTRTSKDELVRKGKDISIAGLPSHWYPDGTANDNPVIGFWPVPTSVISMNVIRSQASSQLSRTANYPFPDDTVPVIRDMVRQLYREHIQDYQGADRAAAAYQMGMQRLHARYLNPTAKRNKFERSDIRRGYEGVTLQYPDVIS